MDSTFDQNMTFIREAVEEIIKPDEIGAYTDDSKRLYRARKFDWIKALIEQVQHSKSAITPKMKCEVIVFLAINELKLVKSLNKHNKYDFFRWEKNAIKSLYAIAKSKDTTPENIADRVTKVLFEDTVYATEKKLLKTLLEGLAFDSNQLGLTEAESSFKSTATGIVVE
jgi:hypothetical protein